VFGSAFIIITFFVFKDVRTFGRKLLVHLSFADLGSSCAYLLSLAVTPGTNALCISQALQLQFFLLASNIWTGCFACYLYRLLSSERAYFSTVLVIWFVGKQLTLCSAEIRIEIRSLILGNLIFGDCVLFFIESHNRVLGSCFSCHITVQGWWCAGKWRQTLVIFWSNILQSCNIMIRCWISSNPDSTDSWNQEQGLLQLLLFYFPVPCLCVLFELNVLNLI
jgi:hypothetical protein